MRHLVLLQLAKKMIKERIAQDPNGAFKSKSGEKYLYTEVLEGYEKMIGWTHPELSSSELVKVVRCKDCMNNRTCERTEGMRTIKYKECKAVSIGRDVHKENFFCSMAIRSVNKDSE